MSCRAYCRVNNNSKLQSLQIKKGQITGYCGYKKLNLIKVYEETKTNITTNY